MVGVAPAGSTRTAGAQLPVLSTQPSTTPPSTVWAIFEFYAESVYWNTVTTVSSGQWACYVNVSGTSYQFSGTPEKGVKVRII